MEIAAGPHASSKQRELERLADKTSADPTPINTLRCGGSRERDGVAHVGEAGDVCEGALEAEAEAGVRYRTVAAQIAVPGVVLPVDAAHSHAPVQHFEPLLTLAAADDLADSRRQHVHRRDGPPLSFTRM